LPYRVGGSLPVVFSYFSEFFSAKKKGPLVIVLASFWMVGQVYTALVAWGLLSNPCLIDGHLGTMPFRSWRVFTMLCTVPALTAAVFFIILPESPSWLYRSGKYERAEKALRLIARVNSICCEWKSSSTVADTFLKSEVVADHSPVSSPTSSIAKDKEDRAGKANSGGVERRIKAIFSGIARKGLVSLKALYRLFTKAYLRTTIVMLIVQVSLSFGYYGLQIWFPEYFENLQNTTRDACAFTGGNCSLYNSSSCSQVYFDSLLETAATIPGTVLGILTINLIGGRIQITFSMILAGLSVFLIWFLPASEGIVVGLSCLFSGFTIIGWNSLDVIEVEYFNTEVRSTALGVLNSAARIAIIASNFTFGAFQHTDPSIPILMASLTLFVGGVFPLFLPLSDDPHRQSLLGKYFRRWMGQVWSRVRQKRTTSK
jgi:VNT family MFS transporter (synaptic vesicle glycoprotein 2)